MIVDLSYPSQRSINDGVDPDLSSIRFSSVDDAVKFILGLGRGTLLLKVDLKSAYRIVPVHRPFRQTLAGNSVGGQLLR